MPLKDGYDSIIKIRMESFARANRYISGLIMFVYRSVSTHVHPFWIQLSYFLFLDFFGSFLLMVLKPTDPTLKPRYVDMFYLSTSALTVSGLATVEMERLSSSQIVVMTILMLLGGEFFVSILTVFCRLGQLTLQSETNLSRVNSQIEMETIDSLSTIERIESSLSIGFKDLRQNSLKYLGFITLGYWVLFHFAGFVACFVYISIIPSAKEILNGKGINLGLFAISTVVSSFANGGLIATNENMAIFGQNSGLLLFVVVLVLAGNTLVPLFLRFLIWTLKMLFKNEEFEYLIKGPRQIKYENMSSNMVTFFQSATVIGIIISAITMFCTINWFSPVFSGLNSYQKIVNALFMSVNARHAGENSVDPSLIAPAVLLLIIFMMYLPSSTTFMPIKEEEEKSYTEELKENSRRRGAFISRIIMPQFACVIIFVIVACIIERRRMLRDPLNFSVLTIIFETVSAYGNVGLSMGYSCARLQKLHPEMTSCVDKPYSFSGWWSDEGKILIAMVMLYGRLKKYSQKNGKAWKL